MRRRELFPADHGLQLRMILTAVMTPLMVVAVVAGMVVAAPTDLVIGLGIVVAIGTVAAVSGRRQSSRARVLAPGEEPAIDAAIERLCALGDLPRPEVVLEGRREPNSWVIDLPGRAPRVHLTRGLVDILMPAELEAVVAHELAHVAHRDATVMSVVGLPGAVLVDGSRSMGWGWWPMMMSGLIARALGAVSQVGTSALSRYRETAADAAAARMTGNPSALASALLKVSSGLRVPATEDMRSVAARNAFNLLPVGDQAQGLFGRLTATHPSVEERVAALERLERRLNAARRRGISA